MDFTPGKYAQLITALKSDGYNFVTFSEYIASSYLQKLIVLRHDVDLLPSHSMRFAELESNLSVRSSYYFRAVSESWDETIIKQIAALGHEVGYHYESLTTCNGDVDAAYNDFKRNLERLKALVPVKTICMHGSPRSPYDSKDIWKQYDYHELGIIGEPYLDVDFGNMFYLTDTGRRWDGYKVSVRDKIPLFQDRWNEQGLTFHSTDDILKAISNHQLPDRIMITTHPQRWNNPGFSWLKEFVAQNLKNIVKRFIIRSR